MIKIKIIYAIILFLGVNEFCFGYSEEGLIFQDSIVTDESFVERRNYDNLTETYTGEDYIYERTVEESGWWIRFKQWLIDFFKNLFSINSDAQTSNIVDLALNLFYIVLIILVVYFIVRAIMNKEGKWIFGKSSNKSIISVTDVESNIHQTDFATLIREAEEENNFRMAVRYHYLWSLKTMTERGQIEYDVEKTNSDYLLEINSDVLKTQFSYASYLYNYIWYGEFEIDSDQYNKAKRAFVKLQSGVKS